MKKRKFSIKYKFMIMTVILALVGIMAVTFIFMKTFSTVNEANLAVIGGLTEELSNETYDNTLQGSSELNAKIVEKQTRVTGEKLEDLRERSELVARMLSAEYLNSEFSSGTAAYCDESPLTESCFYLMPGVAETDEIIAEEKIIEPIIKTIMEFSTDYPACRDMYLITKSGIACQGNGEKNYRGIDLREEAPAYKKAMSNPGKFSWGDIYEDRRRGLCVSGSITFTDSDMNPVGIVGIDVFIDELTSELDGAQIGADGKVFLLARYDGKPQIIPSTALDSDVLNDEEWIQAFETINEGTSGQLKLNYEGKNCFLFYDKVDDVNWSFCSVIEEQEISRISDTVKSALDNTVTELETANEILSSYMLHVLNVVVAIVIAIVLITAFVFAYKLTKPILNLADGAELIGEGKLDTVLKVESKDEIGDLTVVINEMTRNLKEYINELTSATAAKEKVESEMKMAAQIQDGMIPDDPMDVDRVHIEGLMRPAKSVGGDFFDYFMIDDDHLAFIIADVSDKGVPAALFMAIGRTLLREVTLTGVSLDEVFFRVNNILTRNNENMQFITAFEGIIELSTGHVRYANAGHEKPFLLKQGERFEMIETISSIPLGLVENMDYSEGSFEMTQGDIFFQYTDGVTDSVDSKGVMLEESGVERLLNDMTDFGLIHEGRDAFVKGMLAKIDEHAEGVEQFDDITMLLLSFI